MKKLGLVLTLAAACVGGLLGAAPAGAAISCSYSSGSHDVTIAMTANGDSVYIKRSGTAIQANFANCGAATVTNTHHIVVNGSAGAQSVSIDLGEGPFEPGNDGESSTPEIEFQLNLTAGTDHLGIFGGPGNDDFRAGSSGVNLNGDTDADVTLGGVEELTLHGVDGNDTLSAAGGLGTGSMYSSLIIMFGGGGDDDLTGGSADDLLEGGDNNDTVAGGTGDDSLYGDPGIDSLQGGPDRDLIHPGPGNDTIQGGGGKDTLYTEADPDGNDVYSGGTGVDRIDYSIRGAAALNVSLDGVANDGRVGTEFDNVQDDVEDITGSPGPNVITGSDADNEIFGREGNDTLNGGFGDDVLHGEAGADTLNGGGDDDRLDGSTEADHLNGDDGNDQLTGGPGNDIQTGGAGDDIFFADSGPDGGDSMAGGPGLQDNVFYFFRTGDLTITLNGVANDGLAGEIDNVQSDVENVSGGSGNDHITGSSAQNTISGNGGADVINGAAGADNISGNDGNDTISGGDGEDFMFGFNGSDHFKAQDGGLDAVYGGTDAGVDVVDDKDAFDNIFEVP